MTPPFIDDAPLMDRFVTLETAVGAVILAHTIVGDQLGTCRICGNTWWVRSAFTAHAATWHAPGCWVGILASASGRGGYR